MALEEPRIMLYGRTLDNKDQKMVRDYREWRNNSLWNYGTVNGFKGGESTYVIEFDIWNNEPAFNGLTNRTEVKDAENMKLKVWDDDTLTSSVNLNYVGIGFVNARCITDDMNSEFQTFFGPLGFYDIYGNVGRERGVLSGQMGGDHTTIQTKIVIPDVVASSGVPLEQGDVNFVFSLTYEFE